MSMCTFVKVCVCERERKRERTVSLSELLCVSLCVSVSELSERGFLKQVCVSCRRPLSLFVCVCVWVWVWVCVCTCLTLIGWRGWDLVNLWQAAVNLSSRDDGRLL